MKSAVTKAKAYLKVRQKNVRDAMKQMGLDSLMMTHSPDIAYLTNFSGEDSVGIITEKDFYLVTDFRYKEQAELEAGWLKIVVREGKMADALARTVVSANLKRLGFEANQATVAELDALMTAFRDVESGAAPELLPLDNVMLNIRKVKDDNEIDLVRKSVSIAEEAFQAIRSEITVGQAENLIAGMMIMEMRSRGASQASFPVIVAAGANTSLPHYQPGESLVQRDQPLLIDWGANYKGYCSDMTRTLLVGRVSARIKQIYKVVYEAQQAAIQFLRPGVTTMQADRVARDVIDRAGFKEYFGHGLGHGIGREVHELPAMRKSNGDEELRPGMIITVEPGIYLPGEGGVRIEDDVLITHSGCEVLSSLDKSLESCHLE